MNLEAHVVKGVLMEDHDPSLPPEYCPTPVRFVPLNVCERFPTRVTPHYSRGGSSAEIVQRVPQPLSSFKVSDAIDVPSFAPYRDQISSLAPVEVYHFELKCAV